MNAKSLWVVLRSHDLKAALEECSSRNRSLSEDVGCILLCGHLVDEDDTIIMMASNECLCNAEMLGGGMVHLLRTLKKHTLIISALVSGIRRGDSQLMQKLAKPNRVLDHRDQGVGFSLLCGGGDLSLKRATVRHCTELSNLAVEADCRPRRRLVTSKVRITASTELPFSPDANTRP